MKVKTIIATILLIAAGIQMAKAQKVVLNIINNQSAEYNTAQIDSLAFTKQKVSLHFVNKHVAEYSAQQLDSITFVQTDSSENEDVTDPSVTGGAIDITNMSATLVGYASSIRDNLSNDLRVGFIYSLDGTPNKNNGIQVDVSANEVAEDGRYFKTITNLLSDATYYFRSFVYQSGLWFYGKIKSFVTDSSNANFATTGVATSITCFSAKVSGCVDIQSPYSILECGVCYGTGIKPTLNDNMVPATSNEFALQLRRLLGSTIYYYRTYAIVDGQIYYGTVRTFRTLDDNVVETGTIDEETLAVTSRLTIGGGAYSSLVLGVCYGTTEQPTISNMTVTSDEVDEENRYTVKLPPLGYGVYYYRAYVLIDGVPHYGEVKRIVRNSLNPWEDKNDLEGVRYGAYRQMASTISKFALWGDLRSDSYVPNSAIQSDISTHNLYLEIISGMPDSSMNVFDWAGVYTTINYCNKVLQHGPEVLAKDKQFTTGEWTQMRAEMIALRALNYFYLIRAFKDVPYTTKVVNKDSEDESFPLTNQLAVLDSIIKDCESVKGQARNRFSNKRDSKGMITNCAIYAMLADMYLWRGSLHEGRHGKKGTDIVNGEEIAHNVDDDYNKAVEYADLSLQYLHNQNEEEKNNAGLNSTLEETVNYGLANCDMIKNNFEGAAQAIIPNLEAHRSIFGTKNSRESIFELQYSVSESLKNSIVNSLYGFSNGTHLAVNKTALDACYNGGITGEGDNSGMWDSRLWICCQNKLITENDANIQVQPNYYCMKYHFGNEGTLKMDGSTTNREIKSLTYSSTEYNNWIVYRMTDMMLIKAEALACIGKTYNVKTAKAICNAVHRRSYCNYRNSSKTPNPDAMTASACGDGYGTSKKSKNNVTLTEGIVYVMNERQIEFLGEGKRWFDLVRLAERSSYSKTDPEDPREPGVPNGQTGMAAMVELFLGSGSNSSYATTLTNRFKNRYGLYCPIYYMEVKASNGAIEQNPVWNKSKYEQ